MGWYTGPVVKAKKHTKRSITIPDVPDETREKLLEQAAKRNESLEEYVLLQLNAIADGGWHTGWVPAHESMEEARAYLKENPMSVSAETIVEAIHQDRR